MDGEQAIFAILAGFALFLLTQTILGWLRLVQIETRQDQHWQLLKELMELHPRRGNPGVMAHLNRDDHAENQPQDGTGT